MMPVKEIHDIDLLLPMNLDIIFCTGIQQVFQGVLIHIKYLLTLTRNGRQMFLPEHF